MDHRRDRRVIINAIRREISNLEKGRKRNDKQKHESEEGNR